MQTKTFLNYSAFVILFRTWWMLIIQLFWNVSSVLAQKCKLQLWGDKHLFQKHLISWWDPCIYPVWQTQMDWKQWLELQFLESTLAEKACNHIWRPNSLRKWLAMYHPRILPQEKLWALNKWCSVKGTKWSSSLRTDFTTASTPNNFQIHRRISCNRVIFRLLSTEHVTQWCFKQGSSAYPWSPIQILPTLFLIQFYRAAKCVTNM